MKELSAINEEEGSVGMMDGGVFEGGEIETWGVELWNVLVLGEGLDCGVN